MGIFYRRFLSPLRGFYVKSADLKIALFDEHEPAQRMEEKNQTRDC
jgi:hypothetical protein